MRRPWERRRRWLRWGLGGFAVFGVLCAVGLYIAYPRIAAWKIRDKVTATLEARTQRDVDIGAIEVDRDGNAELRELVIRGDGDGAQPLVTIDRITVTYDFWDSVKGRVELGEVTVEGVHVSALRQPDGRDNFSDIVDRLRGRSDEPAPRRRSRSGMRPTRINLVSGDVVYRDLASGVGLSVASMTGFGEPDGLFELTVGEVVADSGVGPSFSLGRTVVKGESDDLRGSAEIKVDGGRASLWPGMSLTGITGTLSEGDRPGKLLVRFEGGYGGAEGTLWNAEGWVDPWEREGSVDMRADRFTFDRISQVLEGSAVIDYDDTAIDAHARIELIGDRIDIGGDFHVDGLTVFHPLLAEKPVRDISLSGPVTASFDRRSRTLTVAQADLVSREVEYKLTGTARLPGGRTDSGERRPAWHVSANFQIPKLPCQKMLDGMPKELVPYIYGAKLRGNFYTDLTVDVNMADIEATQLSGGVGIRGCKVKEMTEAADAQRLIEPFTHYVEAERDQWISFEISEDNPDFVPIWDVSPYLLKSLMTTEDSRFYKHKGFIVSEFRTALMKNLEAGYFKYGASSITMQMVKNVMLYREKTLARKLQELFLTWYVETELEKDRIFEIYVNAIEYGPGLYGIGPAARRYFGKHPRDLNPVEAAFFSSILPNPKDRYRQYCKAKLWRKTEAKIGRILKIMHKRERLTDDEYEVASNMPLVFDRTEALPERECVKLVSEAIENARPTNPLKK